MTELHTIRWDDGDMFMTISRSISAELSVDLSQNKFSHTQTY